MVGLDEATLWFRRGYVMALLRLLHQKGERLCYGCHASQERMNVSAVPMIPCIFLQLPRPHLTYLGSANSVISKAVASVCRINGTI